MTTPAIGVIVVAAGSGTRLGRPEPKAFVPLRGVTILERALAGVLDAVEPAVVVVVAPHARMAAARSTATRVAGPVGDLVRVVEGGETRQASVAEGLAALPPEVDVVLVHDAARALTPGSQFDRVVRAVRRTRAGVIPALPVSDTVKRVAGEVVVDTVDRTGLVQVQTPQGFPRAELETAYAAATEEYTDDAALFSANGGTVSIVEGDARAFKITTPWDLRRAEQLTGAGSGALRTGTGIDVHAYDESAPLWLGGLYWPGEPGLAGHSDGDAMLHAICDALLSATGLGDIGSRFGAADARYRDARSEVFVLESLAAVGGAGFSVVNVAVQVVGMKPKIAPRRSELEARLTALIGAPVTVGATTSDGLGFTGRGEGVAVFATALVASQD